MVNNMLRYRVLSALVGIPLILAFLWYGQIPLIFMIIVLVIIGQKELARIINALGIQTSLGLKVSGSLLMILAVYFNWNLGLMMAALVALVLAGVVIGYPRFTLAGASSTLFGIFYVAWMLAHLYLIRQLPQGFHFLLLVIVANWSTDTLAYFTGRALGKHKLAPVISPNKTVEGALGGITGSVLSAAIFNLVSGQSTLLPHYLILGAGIGIFGQLGDLAESALKRQAGIKDSGNIIPGHGGVLDRFDSILLTAPLAYYYIKEFMIW